MERKEIKFNIPQNAEDKRRLLIDLENNVGVILREEKEVFIVTPYIPKSAIADLELLDKVSGGIVGLWR